MVEYDARTSLPRLSAQSQPDPSFNQEITGLLGEMAFTACSHNIYRVFSILVSILLRLSLGLLYSFPWYALQQMRLIWALNCLVLRRNLRQRNV